MGRKNWQLSQKGITFLFIFMHWKKDYGFVFSLHISSPQSLMNECMFCEPYNQFTNSTFNSILPYFYTGSEI